MAKALLIFPPYSLKEEFGDLSEVGNMQQPLGIGYLGAVLEQADFEVKIIDAPPLGWGIKRIAAEAKEFAPDFIGLSVATVDFYKAVKLAAALKRQLDCPIIIGGPHVTAMPREVLAHSCFDIGILGEGEQTIVELGRALTSGAKLNKIAGIIFKQGRRLVVTQPREFITDLDQLPFPARHLMPPLSAYRPTPATFKKFPVATMITSRGCPYQCTFCFRGVFGNRWRFRSPENVVKEIEVLLNDFGAAEIRLWDDTFNADPERVIAICRLIVKRGLRFPWTCLARVNHVNAKSLKWMKRAGCWQVSYGIESGNDDILRRIKKGTNRKMITQALVLTDKVGIRAFGFFILGLPGDTEQTMTETIEFAKSLPLSAANFTIATPFPGTELWALAKRRGFLKQVAYDKLMVNLPDEPFFVPQGLTAETVKAYEKKAYKEFYRNPRFLWRQLTEIDSLAEFYRKLRAFIAIQSIKK